MIQFSDLEGLLKTKYAKIVNDNVVKKVMLLNQIDASNLDVVKGSREIKHAVRLTRNNSVGFGQMGVSTSPAILPTAKASQVKQAQSLVKSIYGNLELDGAIVRATMSDEGAFAKATQSEMAELVDSMRIELNRVAYGDGSGKLGVVSSVSGAPNNTVVLTNTFAEQLPNIEYFDEGQVLDFWDETGPTKVATLTIQSIDQANITLTMTTDPVVAGVTAGDTIYLANSRNIEPTGLLAMADDGAYVANLHGISNTSYHRWNGIVDEGTTALRALTETMLNDFIVKLERASDKLIFITTEAIRNKIARLIKSNGSSFIQMKIEELKGGFKGISYNGYIIYADMYARNNTLFGFAPQFLKIHQLEGNGKFNGIKFDDVGGVLHQTKGEDSYYAKAVGDIEFTCVRRNAFGRISDIDASL